MEGAGASNVSRAAETRGMDSADEAPELPSAVQDLIRRLEGKGEPITDLPELSEKEFWDFFPKIASPATITGWRSQVRLQVLEAIGNCNTFESLDVDIICGGDISRLTESEWEVVFRGFKSSTVLETISLWDLEWSSDAEVESLCSQIGRMLNSSSVKKLRIVDTNLSEETVGILSQALIQSSSLKVLALYGVKWGEALLLNALARDDGNRSIERLWLQRMDGLGGCLREVLTSNPSLKEVRLNNLRMSSEEWRQLGEFIRDNAIATNTQVSFDGKYVGDNWESIETLARAASSNVKDPTVELVLCFLGDDELMLSLNLLGRVLRGEIKSLKSFSIMECRSSGANQDRPESFLSMKGQTGEASVLKRLGLHVEKEDAWKEVWKELLLCLRGNTSLTHLELSSSRLDEEAFRDLMGLLQVNLTLQEIDLSRTPWERDGKGALIQAALKQNQKRAAYMSVFVEAKLKFGDAKAGRLFLCGSPLAEEFLRKQPHGQKGVDRELIENILINLDLCFKVEDTSQYFIPSFIPEHASTEGQKPQEEKDLGSMAWESRGEHASSEGQKPPEEKDLESIASEPRRETSQFVGIRIQCQDGRTMSLTAAFFPCFQMFMRRKLISEMCVSKKLVTCFRHYLRLFLDGHEIYVEQGKSHNYVDVLMLLSKHKSRSKALQYLMKHIVKELISFCASSKGCPGVALVLGVIQTHCVEKLIPSHLRGAILIEELKSNFIRDINDKLEDIQLDRFHLVKEEELFSYEHSWDAIGGHTGVISERARDLLWENDVEAVVNEIQQKRMQQLGSLQQGLNEVNKDLIHSYPEMKDSNRPSSRCLSRESTSVESREIRDALERIEKKVDGVDERLRLGLQRLEMKMGQILSLQQEFLSTLSDFMSKVDRIIEYPLEFQQTRAPKRPYVTDDVNIFYRMSAKLHVGITVRLHLMCESETGFHLVKDQEGLKIRFDRENCGWIRKTIEISFKLMYYAAKAGLDATLGVGQAIPDWGDLKSDIVKLDGISDRDRRAVLKGGESMELEEAWLRIQQTLAPRLRDNYSSIFKLYQVKYVRLELGGHAWVCEECMEKGRRSGILTN
ncbi:hypothetical protein AXG93_2520s1040 [Marchantia polymorpha subsp. ruderalis]|uniref:Uncharacterized protein n=1 Tax=Marchantia polymorpha subsp. ruderalis TaxID=1480154 RepID=A0A176W3K3_MARPO|nr:hypothetical protein AXG93_2520s1040 [Marchantia polymorpha subsp. ruderalis]